MNIILHSKLYDNKKILKKLESNFDGITVDKPTFIKSDDDITAVFSDCANSYEYDVINKTHEVISFLESKFPNELQEIED